MKRLIPILLALCLLPGCGGEAAESTDPPLTENDVLAAYREAAGLYDQFDLTTLPLDESDALREGEAIWYRVLDYSTLAELTGQLERYFSPEITEALLALSPDHYKDFGGKLYATPGARGSNLYLLDKTVQAEQADEAHWTVTLTFWADFVDFQETVLPGTDSRYQTPVATVGYSQSMLNYEKTTDGWRFTNFCSSDGLDLDADTVFTIDYEQDFEAANAWQDYSDWKLICYLIHADGAYAEAPSDLLYQRFLERPEDILEVLTILDTSPYAETYPHVEAIAAGPGYHAAWLSEEEQAEFLSVLDNCRPETEAGQTVLDRMRTAYEDSRTEAYDSAFCMVAEDQYLCLGPQTGSFPWGCDLQEVSRETSSGDGFGTVYTVDCGTLTVRYGAAAAGNSEFIYSISGSAPGVRTIAGVGVGGTEKDILSVYPTAVFSANNFIKGGSGAWIYPGDGEMLGSHITFYMKDGCIAEIVMEHLPC